MNHKVIILTCLGSGLLIDCNDSIGTSKRIIIFDDVNKVSDIWIEESKKEEYIVSELSKAVFELEYIIKIEYPPPNYFRQPLSDVAQSVRFNKMYLIERNSGLSPDKITGIVITQHPVSVNGTGFGAENSLYAIR